MVHPSTLVHLRRRFNYVSSTLLRNDSLADMSDRNVLYFELFEWLEVRIDDWYLFYLGNLTHVLDHLQSRGASKHDGDADYGSFFH